MAGERANRKLTAIFSADVAGYSRLMADNEEATVRTINAYREVIAGFITDNRGRVVDAGGDMEVFRPGRRRGVKEFNAQMKLIQPSNLLANATHEQKRGVMERLRHHKTLKLIGCF